MRVDANVSVRPAGTGAFGTRCEIKNLNSLRSLGRAIEYEAARQIALLEAGGVVEQETRHWDESAGRTESMRSKEEANDYRYFPEPDLVPLAPDAAWQERVRASLGPMPADRRAASGDRPRRCAERRRGRPDPRRRRPGPRRPGRRPRRRPGAPTALALARAANEVAAAGRGRPAARPGLVRLPARHGVGRPALGDAVQGGARGAARSGRGRPGRPGQGDGLRGPRLRHPGRGARRGHRRAPRRVGPLRGRRRRRGKKLSGFFTGKVMQATSGKANGKEVAAELRRRRSAPAGG